MAKRKRKTELLDTFAAIAGFRDLVNETFEKLTGKSVAAWLKEFQGRPRELPPGQGMSSSDTMSLVDAYAILGLPVTATLAEVKGNYKNLAAIFHPDKGGYQEAMILLNNAHDRIVKGR